MSHADTVLTEMNSLWEGGRQARRHQLARLNPVDYIRDFATLTLGLPRRMGSTAAALRLANSRGKFIYFAKTYDMAYRNRGRFPKYSNNGIWLSDNNRDAARGHRGIRTVVFDCVELCPEDWRKRFEEIARLGRTDDLMVLRVG